MDNSDGIRRRIRISPQDETNERETKRKMMMPAEETKKSWNVFGMILLSFYALLLLGYLRSPINPQIPEGFTFTELENEFELNDKLSHGKRIYNLPGAESIVESSGVLITGLLDGRIVKIFPSEAGEIGGGKVENLTTSTIEIGGQSSRPLGLRLRSNWLYVADAVYGIYRVDIITSQIEMLVQPQQFLFANDLDITNDENIIYFTETAKNIPLSQIAYIYLGGICNGRVFRYEISSKKLEVVADGLCAANGIQLTKDEKSIVVAEGCAYRVTFIELQTQQIIRTINLPFAPDNIRMNGDDGLYMWIAGSHVMTPVGFRIHSMTWMKRILMGLLDYQTLFDLAKKLMLFEHNMVAKMDSQDGRIIETYHDKGGKLTSEVSQMITLSDGRFAVGSYSADFIVLLDLK